MAAGSIAILENTVVREDPRLGRAVEHELRDLLVGEGLGPVEVRVRVCDTDGDGMRFICKVENPPHPAKTPWRWWSPLMRSADDLRGALGEALALRRRRVLEAGAL